MKLFLALSLLTTAAYAQVNVKPPELENVDVVDRLGSQAPLNLIFQDESGQDVPLAKYFNQGKPVVLVLAYYECPMLCTFVLNTLSENVTKLSNWKPGNEFQLITVSINPNEEFGMAAEKKKNYLATLNLPLDSNAWVFLTDRYNNSKTLAQSIGFQYKYDEKSGEYLHPAVTFMLTEKGVLSRYLFGLAYAARDLKLAILEAAEGKVGNFIEKILLFCYHYDPEARGYVLFAKNLMKIGGIFSVLCLSAFLGFFWQQEKKRLEKAA